MRGGGDMPSICAQSPAATTCLRRSEYTQRSRQSRRRSGRASRGHAAHRAHAPSRAADQFAYHLYVDSSSRHRVIAVSNYVRRYLISAGVSEKRVHTIYDGIPKPELVTGSSLRAELGIGADATVACMVTIMRDGKGHEDPHRGRASAIRFTSAPECGDGRRWSDLRRDSRHRQKSRARTTHSFARLSHRRIEYSAWQRSVRLA